jgi:hypothetical protein
MQAIFAHSHASAVQVTKLQGRSFDCKFASYQVVSASIDCHFSTTNLIAVDDQACPPQPYHFSTIHLQAMDDQARQ